MVSPAVEQYLAAYRKGFATPQAHGAALQAVLDQENRYRELFAQDRDNAEVSDPKLHMIPVHEHLDAFVRPETRLPYEKGYSAVLALGEKEARGGSRAVVDKSEFEKNWDLFTEGSLRFLDWSNVFAAGGSVLACLTPIPKEHTSSHHKLRKYFHDDKYKASDIDLFIYGLDEEAAKRKLLDIYEAVSRAVPHKLMAFRSTHAITLVSQYPFRHVQIVLRLYKSPAEVLMGFDVDACAVGFDGRDVYMMPRTHNALVMQFNTVDMSRRSPSYEMRLAKYAERGFEVRVPNLNRARIDPQLFERSFDKLVGLARLLVLERLRTPEARLRFKQEQRARRLRTENQKNGAFWSRLTSQFERDEWLRERLDLAGGVDASDYSTVFLPWGPAWRVEKVARLMRQKDAILNGRWYDPTKTIHTHPCFVGTMAEVVEDCCGKCPPNPHLNEETIRDDPYVRGPLTFITDNPGRQSIGSFHPITEGDWAAGAYLSEDSERLTIAAHDGDLATITRLLDAGADIESRDAMGRTPLILATLANQVAAVRLLLERGATVSPRLGDGRTALHVAAQYDHADALLELLDANDRLRASVVGAASAPAAATTTTTKASAEDEDGGDAPSDEATAPAAADSEKQDPFVAIDAEDWDAKMTPVHYAIFFGSLKALRALLARGASATRLLSLPNVQRSYYSRNVSNVVPLVLASFNWDLGVAKEMCTALIEKGASLNQVDSTLNTALHIFVQDGHLELLEHCRAIDSSYATAVNSLNCASESPLCQAIEGRNIDAVKMLLDTGAHATITQEDLNRFVKRAQRAKIPYFRAPTLDQVKQPLHAAAIKGFPEAVELLIKAGATLEDNVEQPAAPANSMFNNRQRARLPLIVEAYNSLVELLKAVKPSSANYAALAALRAKFNLTHNEKKAKDEVTLATKLKEAEAALAAAKEGTFRAFVLRQYLDGLRAEEATNTENEELDADEKAREQREELEGVRNMERVVEMLQAHLPSFTYDASKHATPDSSQRDFWQSSREEATPAHLVFSFHYFKATYDGLNDPSIKKALDEEHEALYEAIWANDLETVRTMTAAGRGQKRALAAARLVTPVGMTTVGVAVVRGHAEMLSLLLQLLEEQRTPLPPRPAPKKPRQINNFDLIDGSDIDVDDYLDDTGQPQDEEDSEADADPNEEAPAPTAVTTDASLRSVITHPLGISPAELDRALAPEVRDRLHRHWSHIKTTPLSYVLLTDRVDLLDIILRDTSSRPHTTSSYALTPEETEQLLSKSTEAQRLLAPSSHDNVVDFAYVCGSPRVLDCMMRYAAMSLSPTVQLYTLEYIDDYIARMSDRDAYAEEAQKAAAALEKAGHAYESGDVEPLVTRTRISPLECAIIGGNVAAIKWMLSDDAGKAFAAYCQAFPKNEVAVKLVEKHGSPEAAIRSLLSLDNAVLSQTIDRLLPRNQLSQLHAYTPLHYAAMGEDATEVLRVLREAMGGERFAALLNRRSCAAVGATPLAIAVRYDLGATAKALLDAGADVAQTDGERGYTALHLAALYGYEDMARLLLSYEKDKSVAVGRRSAHGITPLHLATTRGHLRILSLFAEVAPFDSTIGDRSGNAMLHIAAQQGALNTLHAALKHTPPEARAQENLLGQTPLDLAMNNERRQRLGEGVKRINNKMRQRRAWAFAENPAAPAVESDDEAEVNTQSRGYRSSTWERERRREQKKLAKKLPRQPNPVSTRVTFAALRRATAGAPRKLAPFNEALQLTAQLAEEANQRHQPFGAETFYPPSTNLRSLPQCERKYM